MAITYALAGVALFALAIGMGLPLLVVGATADTLLPKVGAWTESVKRLLGVVMLAVAIYLVSPVIPVVVQQLLWAALLVVSATRCSDHRASCSSTSRAGRWPSA